MIKQLDLAICKAHETRGILFTNCCVEQEICYSPSEHNTASKLFILNSEVEKVMNYEIVNLNL